MDDFKCYSPDKSRSLLKSSWVTAVTDETMSWLACNEGEGVGGGQWYLIGGCTKVLCLPQRKAMCAFPLHKIKGSVREKEKVELLPTCLQNLEEHFSNSQMDKMNINLKIWIKRKNPRCELVTWTSIFFSLSLILPVYVTLKRIHNCSFYLPLLQNGPYVPSGVRSHRRTERACPLLEGHHRFHLQWAPGLTRGSQKPPHRGTAGAAWLPPQLMHHCCRSYVVLSHH